MANASRDGNFVPTLLAVSNADSVTPVAVFADPSTHRLLVNGIGAGTGTVTGPVSSTDKALVRWNGTGGTVTQNSTAILTDAGQLQLVGGTTGVPGLTMTTATGQNTELWLTKVLGAILKFKTQDAQVRITTNALPILFDSDDAGTLMASIGSAGVNAPGYAVGGVAGVSGSFTAGAKTVTVVNGIITSIV